MPFCKDAVGNRFNSINNSFNALRKVSDSTQFCCARPPFFSGLSLFSLLRKRRGRRRRKEAKLLRFGFCNGKRFQCTAAYDEWPWLRHIIIITPLMLSSASNFLLFVCMPSNLNLQKSYVLLRMAGIGRRYDKTISMPSLSPTPTLPPPPLEPASPRRNLLPPCRFSRAHRYIYIYDDVEILPCSYHLFACMCRRRKVCVSVVKGSAGITPCRRWRRS